MQQGKQKKIPKNIQKLKLDQADHVERVKKMDKLRRAYTQYELGEISKDEFKYQVTDIGIKDTGKLQKILDSETVDNISYKSILANTDLVKHRKPEEKKNPYYTNKYNLGKFNVGVKPILYNDKNEKNHHIKVATNKFLNDKISSEEFKEILRSQGINPDIDAIKKHIRDKTNGAQVNYTDMLSSLTIHKNDTIVTPPPFKHRGLAEDEGKDNQENLMLPCYDNNNEQRDLNTENYDRK